ncbi:TonB-dependent receptor plug domain-containing protein [Hydrogenimonas sp.]
MNLKRYLSLSIMLCAPLLSSEPDIDKLLEEYKIEQHKNMITANEAAGFIDVYSREDLDTMQITRLSDLFKLLTIPYVSKSQNNTAYFNKPSMLKMPNYAIRLYIDDHDMSTGLFQNDTMMYARLSLANIDHIIVYRSSASVDQGNETGTVIIKLYTKDPSKEEGGKAQLLVDQRGSYELNLLYAKTMTDDFSFLVYGSGNEVKRKKFHNDGYTISSDSDAKTLFGKINYKDLSVTFQYFAPHADSFLGLGTGAHPMGEGCSSTHNYLQITQKLPYDIVARLSYDNIRNDVFYADDTKIFAGGAGFVESFRVKRDEDIYSFGLEKSLTYGSNMLLFGTFYKYKKLSFKGSFDALGTDYDNTLDEYSFYIEDKYYFDPTMLVTASFKYDHYRYGKEVSERDGHIARIGFIKNTDHLQFKAFYTKTYYALPLEFLYSDDKDMPYITDSTLKNPELTLKSLGVVYQNEHHKFDLRTTLIDVDNKTLYFNKPVEKNLSMKQYELKYTYMIDMKNRFIIDFYAGRASARSDKSPENGINLIALNSIGKFDIYNLLRYKDGYRLYGKDIKSSIEYDIAIKYHVTSDFSIGLKGENVFNDGFKQAYQSYPEPIQVNDQKFWINLEYLF